MRRVVRVCEEINLREAALVINAALFLSNKIRKDVVVFVNVSEVGIVKIVGSGARRLYPDSESLVGALKALKRGRRLRGISLVNECPREDDKVYCPETTSIDIIDEYVVLDPEACDSLKSYTRDMRVAILNIELDRALYLESPHPRFGG